jgi:hypothetical protein
MPSYQTIVDLPAKKPGIRSSMCKNSSEKKKYSETSSNSVFLSISVAEMDIFHSYADMVPSNCTQVIPFDTSLESDKKGASHCPHRCTTLAVGLNYSQKS